MDENATPGTPANYKKIKMVTATQVKLVKPVQVASHQSTQVTASGPHKPLCRMFKTL